MCRGKTQKLMCLEETNEGKRGRRLHSGFGARGRGGEGSGLYSEMETDTEIDTGRGQRLGAGGREGTSSSQGRDPRGLRGLTLLCIPPVQIPHGYPDCWSKGQLSCAQSKVGAQWVLHDYWMNG